MPDFSVSRGKQAQFQGPEMRVRSGGGFGAAAGMTDLAGVFQANRKRAPRFDSMSATNIKNRGEERAAATRAEAQVAGQGIASLASVRSAEITADAQVKAAQAAASASKQGAMMSGIGSILGAGPMQKAIAKDSASLVNLIPGLSKKQAVRVGQFAGRAAPLLSAVGNVADVADLITSEDGLDNKLVDAAGMGIGGTLGFVLGGGPLGASIGASLGKTVTDGVQGIFFKEPTKEEKLAEALAYLQGGRI